MKRHEMNSLVEKLCSFFNQKGCCLFAGAGVGVRAGLPSWNDFLEFLAAVAEKYEPETAQLMRKRINQNLLIEAAQYYKECIAIPKGEKYKNLSILFDSNPDYIPDKLLPLMALPFSAVVTTNYDRSFHDSYHKLFSNQKESGLVLSAPLYVELSDASMKQAIYWKKFFIARIHGRSEIPETMIVSKDDYNMLKQNGNYQDFLMHVLRHYRCLWVGFSFIDPAISNVLDLMRETLPQPYPQLHLALLPHNCDPKLVSALSDFNIEVFSYNSDNNHEILWSGIKVVQKGIRTLSRESPEKSESIPGIRRYIASCYSRLRLGSKGEPLTEIITEGIVAQAILDSGEKGIDKKGLIKHLRHFFSLSDKQIEDLIIRSTDGLLENKICFEESGLLTCNTERATEFDIDLNILITGVFNRLKVREGIEATKETMVMIHEILNKLFLSRGWDLGAHFAGGHPSSTFDAWDQIKGFIESNVSIKNEFRASIANSILDLFRHPEDKEAEVLSDIGRVAFGVEIILNNSRYFTEQLHLIPKTIYLDANVIMPAIVDGHPYSLVYADAIRRLQRAASATGSQLRIFIAKQFLNEIVSHRKLAIEEVKFQGLDDPDRLKRRILLYGAEGTNVYIGAYAARVGRKKEKIRFIDYLNKYAPYNSEEKLATYLNNRGIHTVDIKFTDIEELNCYEDYKSALKSAYKDDSDQLTFGFDRQKPIVLIEHEARQLAMLHLDRNSGRQPIFVTADKRLIGLCRGPSLGRVANSIVTHLGFIQLIDLVLGIDTDRRALSRILWNVGLSDEKIMIRNYLIDLALQHYDDALARAMWEIVDMTTDRVIQGAQTENINIFFAERR